jgi:PAS domain S-box-containing protein
MCSSPSGFGALPITEMVKTMKTALLNPSALEGNHADHRPGFPAVTYPQLHRDRIHERCAGEIEPGSKEETSKCAPSRKPPLATAFLEDLRDSIVALDQSGRCLYVNRSFERATGFARSELLGCPLVEKIDERQQAGWNSLAQVFGAPLLERGVQEVSPLTTLFRMNRADRSVFEVSVRWDRFPGSRNIGVSFLLIKETCAPESELEARMVELRCLRDELTALLSPEKADTRDDAYSRWMEHTSHATELGKPAPKAELSRREQEVLHNVLDGKRVGTIASELFLSENTVRNHLKRIYRKLGVASLGELREYCSNV